MAKIPAETMMTVVTLKMENDSTRDSQAVGIFLEMLRNSVRNCTNHRKTFATAGSVLSAKEAEKLQS